jgi:GMP synthase-like glutamine amidotransferase
MHQDHNPVVPHEFELLGWTNVSNNQGMVKYYPDARADGTKFERIHILTVQGHPEFTEPIITGVVEYRLRLGIFTPEQAADAMRRRFDPVDGFGLLAKVIWEVVGVPS